MNITIELSDKFEDKLLDFINNLQLPVSVSTSAVHVPDVPEDEEPPFVELSAPGIRVLRKIKQRSENKPEYPILYSDLMRHLHATAREMRRSLNELLYFGYIGYAPIPIKSVQRNTNANGEWFRLTSLGVNYV